jgi:hypothetical protein
MVKKFLLFVIKDLLMRSMSHDKSKLEKEEQEYFFEYTPKLKNSTYGSEEYKKLLAGLKPALDHHYKVNKHHPEHYENGILGMNLLDLVEMICDWYSSTKRHDDGDIMKSIEINQKRFNYSDDLKEIFINTAKLLKSWEKIK